MRILQIGSDRSKRGILYAGSPACARQAAYGNIFGALDIIGFSLCADGRTPFAISSETHVYPTNSVSKLFYGIDTLRILRRLPKPDVISVQDPFEAGLLGLLIARITGIPLHVQVHTDFLSPHYAQHSFLNRLRVAVAGLVLHRAARVRVVSDRVKGEIIARYKLTTHISVLPIFVDTERFRSSRFDLDMGARCRDFKTKILVVSRLESEKNVALAVESFAKSAPQDACLIIVGEGSERARLEGLARASVASARIFFENAANAADYYPLADLVLVTSRYEGYGLVIIEALAAGKPVLSTDVGIARAAGAIIASEQEFPEALAGWFKGGPRTMHLQNYPYKNFEEYVREYCDDIAACAK